MTSEALMQDFKAGQLIGSNSRSLTIAQLIAAPIGSIATVMARARRFRSSSDPADTRRWIATLLEPTGAFQNIANFASTWTGNVTLNNSASAIAVGAATESGSTAITMTPFTLLGIL